ncbi:His-Xaa-Ser system radical SAM maturase HxsC [Bradyrhizobium sp. USDA 4503]
MSLTLHLRAEKSVSLPAGLYKVLDLREALTLQTLPARVLIDLRSGPEADLAALGALGFGGAILGNDTTGDLVPNLRRLTVPQAVGAGDAIRVQMDGRINILFRRGANANSLFMTERCNSLCVMCSQPPRDGDDSWRVAEILDLLDLIDRDQDVLGLTGGEPTLLGDHLVSVLHAAAAKLPTTRLHVLTNGRQFANPSFAAKFGDVRGRVTWAVPLYAASSRAHDEIVGASGAFSETMHGLYNLAELRHDVEIRSVLHAMSLSHLPNLCEFITRNLPFARHVALMGMEPMGFARKNMATLYVDPEFLGRQISPGVDILHRAGMRVSVYNIPLCLLDSHLHPFARQSISDWKNEYADACGACRFKPNCSGFFRSADRAWRDRVARPLRDGVPA